MCCKEIERHRSQFPSASDGFTCYSSVHTKSYMMCFILGSFVAVGVSQLSHLRGRVPLFSTPNGTLLQRGLQRCTDSTFFQRRGVLNGLHPSHTFCRDSLITADGLLLCCCFAVQGKLGLRSVLCTQHKYAMTRLSQGVLLFSPLSVSLTLDHSGA